MKVSRWGVLPATWYLKVQNHDGSYRQREKRISAPIHPSDFKVRKNLVTTETVGIAMFLRLTERVNFAITWPVKLFVYGVTVF